MHPQNGDGAAIPLLLVAAAPTLCYDMYFAAARPLSMSYIPRFILCQAQRLRGGGRAANPSGPVLPPRRRYFALLSPHFSRFAGPFPDACHSVRPMDTTHGGGLILNTKFVDVCATFDP